MKVWVFLIGAVAGVRLPLQALDGGDDSAATAVRWRKRKRKEVMMMMMTCS